MATAVARGSDLLLEELHGNEQQLLHLFDVFEAVHGLGRLAVPAHPDAYPRIPEGTESLLIRAVTA
jgi:hypothetical protein